MNEMKNLVIEKTNAIRQSEDIATDPELKTKINLSDEEKKRVVKEIEAELKAIEVERKDFDLESKIESAEKQYDGEMREVANMQFNLSRKTTAIKVNAVVRAIMEAFFEGDHLFTVTPRPDFEGDDVDSTTERIEDFIDYKVDEVIPLEEAMSKVTHRACNEYGGILKISQKYKIKKRKTDEEYSGEWKPAVDDTGNPIIKDGAPMLKNEGLEAFLRAYPMAATKYPQYIKMLQEGKDIRLLIEYDEVVYDDPLPQSVNMVDLFARKATDGIDGFRDAYLIAERKEYSYWELLQEEKEEQLFDIEDLTYEKSGDEDGERRRIENYANEKYELYECVFHTKLKDSDDEYIRCVFHVDRERGSLHSASYYYYWGVDTYYIPFYVKDKDTGLYRKGIGPDIKDLHIAQNILLNLALEAAYTTGMVTPIVKEGSKIAEQFSEKTWTSGDPLIIRDNSDKPDFLQKYMGPTKTQEITVLGQMLGQEAGDVVGISDAWATGKADPLDPSAPAQKTRDLLKQAGVNLKDYIKVFGRSWNEVGNVLMQMYYQRNQKSHKYRRTRKGEKEFKEISRADMAAKVNYQTQAHTFDIDKLNAKREQLALWQVIRGDRAFNRDEKAVHFAMRKLIKSWGQSWKDSIDKLMPDTEEFKKERVRIASQAVAMFVQQTLEQAKMTNQPPDFDPKQLLAIVDTMLRESMTEPTKEEIKQREKGAGA